VALAIAQPLRRVGAAATPGGSGAAGRIAAGTFAAGAGVGRRRRRSRTHQAPLASVWRCLAASAEIDASVLLRCSEPPP
jgi:hypothetical protein